MADRYLLESGAPDGYLLEDGGGVLLLETGGVKCLFNISQFRAGFAQVRSGLQVIEDQLVCALAPSTFTVDAVAFNGSSGLTRGAALTGVSDSGDCLISFFVKTTDAVNFSVFSNAVASVQIRTDYAQAYDSGGTNGAYNIYASSINNGAWHHVLIAIRLSTSTIQVYIDGADASTGVVVDGTPSTAYFSDTNWAFADTVGGGNAITADFAEFYFAPGQYLDISNATNRAKFISTGKPVDLGSDGSTPTGTQPAVYLSVRPGDAATVFATNKGTGGNFSVSGSLSIAATSPSD